MKKELTEREKIIERLVNENKITFKEALFLLEKDIRYVPSYQPYQPSSTDTYPNIYPNKPLITYETIS